MKIAVVLFNLGGPDHPAAVRPFLFNLFSDAAIIRLPAFLRLPLAFFIAKFRAPKAQLAYNVMGGASPILANTLAQAHALQHELRDVGAVQVFTCMRYWHPMSFEVVQEVKNFAPEKIVLLPLYPQFSTTTTASSLRLWHKIARQQKLQAPTQTICCYPTAAGFIATQQQAIRAAYATASQHGAPRILFSAHGLPENVVRAGDPYQMQCERTTRALVEELALPGLDWRNCYQSRVGPLQWIGPATEHEIMLAGQEKKPLVVVPIAFVSEHVETLVELDDEYGKLASAQGVPFYARVPTVSVAPAFIATLGQLVRQRLARPGAIGPADGQLCGAGWRGCPCYVSTAA